MLELTTRKGMNPYQTKPTEKNPVPQDVNAGQWWRLNDMPDVGIIGDGGEARGIVLNEIDEPLFHVRPSDWIVETSPEVYEKFTSVEFNDNFRAIIRDTLNVGLGGKDGAQKEGYEKEYKA